LKSTDITQQPRESVPGAIITNFLLSPAANNHSELKVEWCLVSSCNKEKAEVAFTS